LIGSSFEDGPQGWKAEPLPVHWVTWPIARTLTRKDPVMRGIILWLCGVPLVVIIGLYLFHVI